MENHIDGPPRAGTTTRRRALGLAAGLLAGGALSLGATAPGSDAEPLAAGADDDCPLGYDAEFEEALAEGVADFPEQDDERNMAPRQPRVLPLRRRYRVSARYGVRGQWAAGHHTGIDLAVPRGTPVYAVGGGRVVLAAWSGAYGMAVTVRMPDGHYAVYAHLSRVSVRRGSRISTGTRLGSSGATGRATGPHLHLEIREKRGYGSDVNPVRYLARRGADL
ncbi:M23 family metallopeptidase [Streptomyces flavofungini]|uniref:M23 family metallopeptidase n=1 Tax=Streptomyces flavofungini TaxID=68200 RepID=UPI0034DEAEA8